MQGKGKDNMMRRIRLVLAALGFLLIGAIGYYGYSFYQFGQNIQKSDNHSLFPSSYAAPDPNASGVKVAAETFTPPKWEGKEPVNVILLGGDSRGLRPGEVPRSDTILVASLDPVSKQATLFSIMRDMYVNIPGHGSDRVNSALQLGGPALTMRTVSELTGLPIQYYAYTDFKGFIALVDAVGGIDMMVEKDMKYSDSEDGPEYDINLKKGYQHLDGKTALQYVRFRHDALSDYARTERQRSFLKALAIELQTTESLLKLPKILSSIDPYIETNLTVSEMLKLGSLAFDLDTESMKTLQLPPLSLLQEKTIRGAAVLTADDDKLREYVREQLEEKPKTNTVSDLAADNEAEPASAGTERAEDR